MDIKKILEKLIENNDTQSLEIDGNCYELDYCEFNNFIDLHVLKKGDDSIILDRFNHKNLDFSSKHIMYLIEKYNQGEVKCSSCGKWIKLEEAKNYRFFAGIYCDECWNVKHFSNYSLEQTFGGKNT